MEPTIQQFFIFKFFMKIKTKPNFQRKSVIEWLMKRHSPDQNKSTKQIYKSFENKLNYFEDTKGCGLLWEDLIIYVSENTEINDYDNNDDYTMMYDYLFKSEYFFKDKKNNQTDQLDISDNSIINISDIKKLLSYEIPKSNLNVIQEKYVGTYDVWRYASQSHAPNYPKKYEEDCEIDNAYIIRSLMQIFSTDNQNEIHKFRLLFNPKTTPLDADKAEESANRVDGIVLPIKNYLLFLGIEKSSKYPITMVSSFDEDLYQRRDFLTHLGFTLL